MRSTPSLQWRFHMELLLDYSTTTPSQCPSKPHHSKLSPRMTANVTSFWTWAAPINNSIPKDSSLNEPFYFSLPCSADFTNPIIGKCFLYKKDLKGTCCQIPVDPRDSNLLLTIQLNRTIFYILIWFFPSACVWPTSLANVQPAG